MQLTQANSPPAIAVSPLHAKFEQGLNYADFLARYANPQQKERWQKSYDAVTLTAAQRELLGKFVRQTDVLVLNGAWCGDCINQVPIFEHFAAAAPVLKVRYVDRDEYPDLKETLKMNGGDRVPIVVFFSEDGAEVARYGDRTLTKYRQLVRDQVGASCSSGITLPNDPLQAQVVQEWLDQFERVQWVLRLSPRLRTKHGD
jgi:thiol-disulfide isomerase/thioredoxin